MPCRVGISTNPEARRADWERRVVGLRNWRIIGTHYTRIEAQAQEDDYANRHGCISHGGGRDARGPWHVYRFDYIRKRQ